MCFLESDSVAVQPEATSLYQPAAVPGLRIPAETRSFVNSSAHRLTQPCVFPGRAGIDIQLHADAWRKFLPSELHPSVRNGFEDLDRLEALGTCLWSSIRREASLCSWWKDRITELKMGLRPQFLTLVCNVILEISRYAVDWCYWWTMQTRFENCSSEALKSTGGFHLLLQCLEAEILLVGQ